MAACVITVSQDGTGDYGTVQDAVDAVPLGNTRRTVIRVAPGIYKQPVYVPKTKNFITLAGLSPEDTVLTWQNTASLIDHHQVRSRTVCLLPPSGFLKKIFVDFLGCGWVMGPAGLSGDWDWDVWVWEHHCGRGGFHC
jgi:pectin methylesterase-like acyl-CoA thioesterase